MRWLANENIPAGVAAQLQASGHDVVWVRVAAPGSKDEDILEWAARETRVLLTFDQDFGELAWRRGLPFSSGIVLLRIPMPAAKDAASVLVSRLNERTDWQGHFAVVEPGRIRMRPFAARRNPQN